MTGFEIVSYLCQSSDLPEHLLRLGLQTLSVSTWQNYLFQYLIDSLRLAMSIKCTYLTKPDCPSWAPLILDGLWQWKEAKPIRHSNQNISNQTPSKRKTSRFLPPFWQHYILLARTSGFRWIQATASPPHPQNHVSHHSWTLAQVIQE